MVKYPEVQVQLVGHDGNAFAIMSRVTSSLRRAGVPSYEIDEFLSEAMSGTYENLLNTANEWVSVS